MTSGTDRRPSGASRRPVPLPSPLVGSPAAHGLSAALAVVTVAATVPAVVVDGLLQGPPAMNGSARGTALVMLVLGVPALLVGQLGTRRGVRRAVPLWLGSGAFLLYNAFLLLFATPFNRLFLLDVATFSLALWMLVAIVAVVDVAAFDPPGFPARLRRTIAVITWVVVAVNAAAWLRQIGPALGSRSPAFLAGTGLPTAPTYVQDLAVWLPLMAAAGIWLWRGLARGFLIVAAMLSMWVAESVSIAVDQAFGAAADPAATVVSAAMTPVFAVVAGLIAIPAGILLYRL